MHEIEVKIAIRDPAAVRGRLAEIGARTATQRLLEDNRLYDDADLAFKEREQLLRVRTVGGKTILTFKKKPAEDDTRYKVRIEHETQVDDPEQLDLILRSLELKPVYRYQKYRQKFVMPEAEIVLDETPIGDYIEIEAAPERIDELAAALGYGPSHYLTKTYHELHVEHARCDPPGDMVFEPPVAERD